MSSVECLREFFIDRLTAAAEEIFGVFKKTIVEYEEEIDRQRKLLDVAWKGDTNVHRIEPPQQQVIIEEAVLTDKDRNSILDQDDPEPPQIKEEADQRCNNQEGDMLVVKVETDTFVMTPTYEESDHSEPEPRSDHQILFENYHVAASQYQSEDNHGASGSSRTSETTAPSEGHHRSRTQTNSVFTPHWSGVHYNAEPDKRPFKCYACGKAFNYKSNLNEHMRIHTGAKPYPCTTCERRFCRSSDLNKHMRVHTGEKPYICNTCGKRFRGASNLSAHIRTHTGEKPYSCEICGKDFSRNADLTVHIRRAHTGEKPYLCKICGNRYFDASHLAKHTMRSHKGKKH